MSDDIPRYRLVLLDAAGTEIGVAVPLTVRSQDILVVMPQAGDHWQPDQCEHIQAVIARLGLHPLVFGAPVVLARLEREDTP